MEAAFGYRFVELFWGIGMKNRSFGIKILDKNFGE